MPSGRCCVTRCTSQNIFLSQANVLSLSDVCVCGRERSLWRSTITIPLGLAFCFITVRNKTTLPFAPWSGQSQLLQLTSSSLLVLCWGRSLSAWFSGYI